MDWGVRGLCGSDWRPFVGPFLKLFIPMSETTPYLRRPLHGFKFKGLLAQGGLWELAAWFCFVLALLGSRAGRML